MQYTAELVGSKVKENTNTKIAQTIIDALQFTGTVFFASFMTSCIHLWIVVTVVTTHSALNTSLPLHQQAHSHL
jgi:hypothetical protein